MSCISAHDPQLERLANAIAQRVGQQRFHVWFDNSTRLDLKQDGLEIAVPNDFISEWIGRNFSQPIQDAAHEVLGCTLAIRFSVVPQLFGPNARPLAVCGAATVSAQVPQQASAVDEQPEAGGVATAVLERPRHRPTIAIPRELDRQPSGFCTPAKLRHDISSFVVGPSNQLAYNAALHVSQFPGSQYNPLFIHGTCGIGKTHLLQGLCRKFIEHHPAKRWLYMTGEEFTNEFQNALRHHKMDGFRRRMRDLDLLVIDDVHFLGGKHHTQEEFLHTFNAIEANGRQVVMASDNHPKMIEAFGEALINRFVSGMVVRIDPPNHAMRCQILRGLSMRAGMDLSEEAIAWIARRVTQNVREIEGAVTRIGAHVKLTGRKPDMALVQEALGDLDRQLVAPARPEGILDAVCHYFALEMRDLMSGRRQRTISLAQHRHVPHPPHGQAVVPGDRDAHGPAESQHRDQRVQADGDGAGEERDGGVVERRWRTKRRDQRIGPATGRAEPDDELVASR